MVSSCVVVVVGDFAGRYFAFWSLPFQAEREKSFRATLYREKPEIHKIIFLLTGDRRCRAVE